MLEHDITASSIAKNDETRNDISEIQIEKKEEVEQQGSDVEESIASDDGAENKLAQLDEFLK